MYQKHNQGAFAVHNSHDLLVYDLHSNLSNFSSKERSFYILLSQKPMKKIRTYFLHKYFQVTSNFRILEVSELSSYHVFEAFETAKGSP